MFTIALARVVDHSQHFTEGQDYSPSWEPISFFPLNIWTECRGCSWPLISIQVEWKCRVWTCVVKAFQIHKEAKGKRKQEVQVSRRDLLGKRWAENWRLTVGRRDKKDHACLRVTETTRAPTFWGLISSRPRCTAALLLHFHEMSKSLQYTTRFYVTVLECCF